MFLQLKVNHLEEPPSLDSTVLMLWRNLVVFYFEPEKWLFAGSADNNPKMGSKDELKEIIFVSEKVKRTIFGLSRKDQQGSLIKSPK